jgi:two-component system sensor histidine kinase KdpD
VDLPDDLPLVAVDAALMEQVINNLIGNSLKFAPRGTVITICARVEEPVLRVSIRNQGPPIPEEHIGHIFEKFYPVPGMDQQRGTGLGLSICQGIVEAHGGRIWAENLVDGEAFNFTLPLEWEGSRPVLPPSAPEEETEGL